MKAIAAVQAGATLVLLPMARRMDEIEAFLRCLDGRCDGGILIETRDAVAAVSDLAKLPLAAVYVGLHDLSIDRGLPHLFTSVADGTVEAVANSLNAGGIPFGFAGVTIVDGGAPIPCRLLMAEMARLGASFSFMRRSFKRDIVGRDVALEIVRIQEYWLDLKHRDAHSIERDRTDLMAAIAAL